MAFNLVRDPWMPVLDASGRREFIRPAQVVEIADERAWLSFDTGRAELDMACLEFLIGLLAVVCPPESTGQFAEWFERPPTVADLDAAFEQLEPAFDLDAPQKAFMQDPFPVQLEGVQPIHELLLAAGSGELFFTPSFFTRGERREIRFSRRAVAVALHAHQITSPSGGRGYRTSPRGGGPLTTLLVPLDGEEKPHPLWQRAWINVPQEAADAAPDRDLTWFFPWMKAPEAFDFATKVVPGIGVDPAQVLFPMPRRVVVDWEPNVEGLPCDLTGHVDEVIARTFRRVHGGLDYPSNVWRHPFTPRYKQKASDPATIPLRPGTIAKDSLGDWVSLTCGRSDGTSEPAPIVDLWVQRRRDVVPDVRLHACGFAMDNAKVEDWIDRTVPVIVGADPAASRAVMRLAAAMADAAYHMGVALKDAVKGSTYSEKAQDVNQRTLLAGVPARLVQDVRPAFFEMLERVLRAPSEEEAIKVEWLARLGEAARALLDDLRPLQEAGGKDLREWLKHRRFLGAASRGTSPAGAAIWKSMGLTPVEKAGKAKAKGKPKKVAGKEEGQP